ncbi:MAG TPA: hypothetical protein VFK47_22420, partial [Ktedonobacteraceae bacterium]|nr:hypothetical protein [Ktedonobacteraceae bacterium]
AGRLPVLDHELLELRCDPMVRTQQRSPVHGPPVYAAVGAKSGELARIARHQFLVSWRRPVRAPLGIRLAGIR